MNIAPLTEYSGGLPAPVRADTETGREQHPRDRTATMDHTAGKLQWLEEEGPYCRVDSQDAPIARHEDYYGYRPNTSTVGDHCLWRGTRKAEPASEME